MPVAALILVVILLGAVASVTNWRGMIYRFLLRRKYLALCSIFLAVCLLRLALLPVRGIPKPAVTDEFSYLLMADTFLLRRLANPPHTLWRHFESLLVLSQPTYSSIYPVAQGLILGAGELLTGSPWAGVLVSAAAMCAALFWMLRAWVPPRWALLGTVLAIFQFGATGYWMDSFWGGAHAAIGGALVLGAVGRVLARKKQRGTLLLGVGIAILANSRPYEGFVFSCSAVGVLVWQLRKMSPAVSIARRLLPAAAVLALAGVCMSYYFFRVTGNPLEMPNEAYIRQYAIAPVFFWQKLRPEPGYSSPAIRDAMLSFLADYRQYASAAGVAGMTVWKIMYACSFLLGPLLFVPFVMLPWLTRDRAMRPLLICCAATFAAIALVVPFQPHYAAPMTSAIVALNVQSLRRLWIARRWGNTLGTYLVPAAPVMVIAFFVAGLRTGPASPLAAREALTETLLGSGGLHLVIVHTGPGHSLAKEWIHNGPEIDSQQVVWARDLGHEENRVLERYFPGRQVWEVDPDRDPLAPVLVRAVEGQKSTRN